MSNLNPDIQILIDKITLNFDDPDPRQVPIVAERLRTAAQSAFTGAVVRQADGYSAFVTIPLPLTDPGSKSALVVQAEPHDRNRSSYRIEFNPAKVGPQGVADLDLILTSVLGISASTFFRDGNVTRLDLAVDISGLSVNDVIVRSSRQRKHAVYSDPKGNPVTVYLGGARSNRTVTYDKPTSGARSPTVLRLERRIHPKCFGKDLRDLRDPFARIAVIKTEQLKSLLSPVPPDLFFDSARVRGIKRAIAMLPADQQKSIGKAIAKPDVSIVGSDIWQSWPETLRSSGIAHYLLPFAHAELNDAAALALSTTGVKHVTT